jgi:hypothetical protein
MVVSVPSTATAVQQHPAGITTTAGAATSESTGRLVTSAGAGDLVVSVRLDDKQKQHVVPVEAGPRNKILAAERKIQKEKEEEREEGEAEEGEETDMDVDHRATIGEGSRLFLYTGIGTILKIPINNPFDIL